MRNVIHITHIGTLVNVPFKDARFVVLLVWVITVTTTEQFVYFVSAVHLNISCRCRGRITAGIYLSDAGLTTTFDDNLCGMQGIHVVIVFKVLCCGSWSLRNIGCQVTTAINLLDIVQFAQFLQNVIGSCINSCAVR